MSTETEQLAALIAARHECLRQLHTLGQRQLESIQAHDLSQLMKILAGKQRLLVNLQDIGRQLDPFRGQSPENRRWPTPQERDRSKALARQCETLLAQIVAQEKQSEALLTAERDEAARRLHGAHSATRARGAYANQAEYKFNQLDLSSES